MGRLQFDVRLPRGQQRGDGAITRLLVVASLSGRDSGLGDARLRRIDVENFDDVLRELTPELEVAGQTLSFGSLDDFHPDQLYEVLNGITALRRSRAQLANPRTFEAERERLVAEGRAESNSATLERLLGQRAEPQPPAEKPRTFDQLLRDLVAPHIARAPGKEQGQLIASVDAAISSELCGVLHAPAFQRLEASWRGLRNLVFGNPLGAELEVYVLDASRAALLADLRACAGQLERSQLQRAVAAGPGFALVVSDVWCAGGEEDVALFAGLGAVAGQAGACLLAGADASLWSEPDAERAARFALLRGSAVAPFIGLCAPRILGRVPYGPKSDPTERFDFVELGPDADHEACLWLNPAFACAQLILEGVAQGGWAAGPGAQLELGDLPQVVRGDTLVPCAEVLMNEAAAQRIASAGIMPFCSYRNRNAVRLACLQSIADPPAPLALRNG